MSKSHSDIKAVLLNNMSSSDAKSDVKISAVSPAELSEIRESEIRTCISMMEKYIKRFYLCLWIARLIEFGGLAYATKILVGLYGPYSQQSEDRVNDLHQAAYNTAVAERTASLPNILDAFVNASCHTRTIQDWWIDSGDMMHDFTNQYGSRQAEGIMADRSCPLATTRVFRRSLDDRPPEICSQLLHQFCSRPELAYYLIKRL